MSEDEKKPKDTAFRQQRLRAFRPVHTAKSSAIVFLLLSLGFFALGILLYVENSNQTELTLRYDNQCKISSSCKVFKQITTNIAQPVFIYYELVNFYQNHRLFVKSKSYTQLRGDSPSSTELGYCGNARYNSDFVGYYSGKSLNPGDTARPCGLIARSVFNDTIALKGYSLEVKNIVDSVDREMYQDIDPSTEWRTVDEHLIVWMKIAPMPTFRKLYGILRQDLTRGVLEIDIANNYDVSHWDGEKSVIISTNGKFGGKNVVLGVVLFAAGVFSLVCCLIFIAAALFNRQTWKEQDPRTWKF